MKIKWVFLIIICSLIMSSLPGCSQNNVPVPPTATLPKPTATQEPTLEPIATPVPPTPTSIPPTSTPTPIAIPLLSKSPELILAINKPNKHTTLAHHVVYKVPEMDNVLVANELVFYQSENKIYDDLTVDIYYPPNYQFGTKLPIVILSHGFSDRPNDLDKDMWQHMDWAKLIAASGMIAVSAQAGNDPVKNSHRVFDFLAANADLLGVDLTRIGFWACSGQGQPVFDAFKDKNSPYRDAFKSAVFLYLDIRNADPSLWPPDLSLFVVKAGKDEYLSGKVTDNFVTKARSNNIPTEYIELADAPHGFDGEQDTQVNQETIQKALEFFKTNLLP
jgi:hypothetical protein